MTTNQETHQAETHQARNILYRQLMTVAHREYTEPVAQFRDALISDPDFVARACAYIAFGNTKIRDQIDIAIITLLQAPNTFPRYREAGRTLLLGDSIYKTDPDGLNGLPPFRIFRIARFIAGSETKIPRLMKSLMTHYIHALESNITWFDSVAMQNLKNLKWAYTHFHIKPSTRAQRIVFDNNPPRGSKRAILKKIANSKDIAEKAKLVIEHKIPYRIASTLLPKSPEAGIAFVAVMSPTEALNARAWMEKSGLLNIPEVRDVFVTKVKSATASGASIDHRVSAQGSDEEIQEAVKTARQKAIEDAPPIEKDLLLLVDKSQSMEGALEIAVQFGARIAPRCTKDLMVVVFNSFGQILEVQDHNQLSSWEEAFHGQRAGGMTNMQRGFETAIDAGFMPESIVIITDGGENDGSHLAGTIQNYRDHSGIDPQITTIVIDGMERNGLHIELEPSGLRYDQFEYTGDYYLFDQVNALLGGKAPKSIIEQILSTELPRRAK